MSATKFLLSMMFLLLLLTFVFPGDASIFSNVQERESTIADMVMRSREVAPAQEAESGASIYTVLLLVSIVIVGGAILFMYFGADFLKQLRLTRKSGKRRGAPPPQLPPLRQTLRPVPQLQQVSEVDDALPYSRP